MQLKLKKQKYKKQKLCIAQALPRPCILLRADISHILHFPLPRSLALFISLACPRITPSLAPNQQWVSKASSCRMSRLLSIPQSFHDLKVTIKLFSALQFSILHLLHISCSTFVLICACGSLFPRDTMWGNINLYLDGACFCTDSHSCDCSHCELIGYKCSQPTQ